MSDFTLPEVIESLESVQDSELHSLYFKDEVEGKFKINPAVLKITSGLKSAVDKERADRKRLERENRDFESKYSTLSSEHDTYKTSFDADKTKIIEEVKANYSKLLAEKESATNEKISVLTQKYLNREVEAEIYKAGGNAALLKPIIKECIKQASVADGDLEIQFNEFGGEMPKDLSSLLQSLKASQDYKMAFAIETKTGAGTSPKATGGGPAGDNPFSLPMSNPQRPMQISKLRALGLHNFIAKATEAGISEEKALNYFNN
jgi:hypothetical protein